MTSRNCEGSQIDDNIAFPLKKKKKNAEIVGLQLKTEGGYQFPHPGKCPWYLSLRKKQALNSNQDQKAGKILKGAGLTPDHTLQGEESVRMGRRQYQLRHKLRFWGCEWEIGKQGHFLQKVVVLRFLGGIQWRRKSTHPVVKLDTDRLNERGTETKTPNQGRWTVFGKKRIDLLNEFGA